MCNLVIFYQNLGDLFSRSRLKLKEYDYNKLIYKLGQISKNADALSRIKIDYFKESNKLKLKIFMLIENSNSENTIITDEREIE